MTPNRPFETDRSKRASPAITAAQWRRLDEYSDIDALHPCREFMTVSEKTRSQETKISRWGVAVLPLSVFVGVVLGAAVGAAVANIGIGVAIGAGVWGWVRGCAKGWGFFFLSPPTPGF